MKATLRAFAQKITLLSTAFILAVSTLTASLPFILSQKASAIGATTIATTNLAADGWDLSESRSAGHSELVANGLHVWTEPSGGSYANEFSKSAGYHAAQPGLLLEDIDSTAINFVAHSGVRPSVQLGVDRDGNGSWDGYLVYEPWAYEDGMYWTNKTGFGVPAGAGYPSYGTLDDYQTANPYAKVLSIGYSLGSGVVGDAIISSIVIGETTYTFNAPAPAPEFVSIDPYYVTSKYKGIAVDIKVNHLTDATNVAVQVDRSNGGPVVKTAKQSTLNTLNAGTLKSVTAPIVIQDTGVYDEDASSSWNKPVASWDDTTLPEHVTVTITRANGDTLVLDKALGEDNGPFATRSQVMPAYVNELPQVSITSPAQNGVVSTKLPATLNQLIITGTFKDNKAPNYLQLELVRAGNLVALGNVYGSTVNPDGTFTYNFNVPATLQSGEYSLFYTGTDFENGVTTRYERVFTIDNNAPNISWQVQPNALYGIGQGFNVRPITSEVGTLKQVYIDVTDAAHLVRELDSDHKNFDTSTAHNPVLWASLTEGTHHFIAVFTDHAGNSTTSTSNSFIVDHTAPTLKVNLNRQSYVTSGATVGPNQVPEIQAADTHFDRVEVIKNGTVVNSWSRIGTYTERRAKIGFLSQGTYTIRAYDAAGNTSDDFVITIDKTGPTTSIDNATVLGDTVSFEGTVSDTNLNYYYCYLTTNQTITVGSQTFTPGQEVGSRNADCVTTWANGTTNFDGVLGGFDIAGMPDGDYTVNLVAYDRAGNNNVASPATFTFTLDRTAPAVAIVTVTTTTITGTADPDATIVLTIDGIDTAPFAPAADGTWTYTLATAFGTGSHSVVATAYDSAGNARTATASLTVDDTSTVVITDNTTQQQGFTLPPAFGPAAIADVQGDSTSQGTPGVEGTSTEKTPAQAVDVDSTDGTVFGLAWYWWLLILAAIAAAAWWVIAAIRRRQAE